MDGGGGGSTVPHRGRGRETRSERAVVRLSPPEPDTTTARREPSCRVDGGGGGSRTRVRNFYVDLYMLSPGKINSKPGSRTSLWPEPLRFTWLIYRPQLHATLQIRTIQVKTCPAHVPGVHQAGQLYRLSCESEVLVIVGTCSVLLDYLRGFENPRHAI